MEELKEMDGAENTGNQFIDSLNSKQIRSVNIRDYHPPERLVRARRKALSKISDIQATISHIDFILRDVYTESKDLTTMSTSSAEFREEKENLTDFLGNAPVDLSMGNTRALETGQRTTKRLDDFFDRPILIQAGELTEATNINDIYGVWDLFTTIPSVRSKFRNYAYVRADLEVTIAISGTPFHYGKMLVSYQPMPIMNEVLGGYSDMLAINSNIRQCMLNYLSQSPGSVVMDVKENQPVVLTLPFILHKPMARLFNTATTTIAANTPFSDFADMGYLYFWSLNNVGSVNSTLTPISYSIYARMVNVEVTALSATILAITTESKDLSETETGPVERYSSRAATFLTHFTKIPVIGPYARASNIAFSGMSSIAALFGWSRPYPDSKPVMVKNLGAQNSAHAIGFDTPMKISYDPHQEVTVDPRVCGSDEDEMMISHVCARESYYGYFAWPLSATPYQTVLAVIPVNPSLGTKKEFATNKWVTQPTALGFASGLFEYWRGDITFRFEVVCSAYHRGKLAFIYEPNYAQEAGIIAATSLNKQYIRILDIAESQSVELTVKWAHAYPWLKTYCASTSGAMIWIDKTYVAAEHMYNGFVYVVVLNTITSPDDSDVVINTYVKSDDMSFNFLTNRAVPASRTIWTESKCLSSTPVTSSDWNVSSATKQHISEVCFGEEPISFRAVLKRYNTVSYASTAATSGLQSITNFFNRVPVFDPPISGSSSVTYGTFIGYLRPAYLGMRGGTKMRIRALNDIYAQGPGTMSQLVTNTYPAGFTANSSTAATTSAPYGALIVEPLGTVTFFVSSNGGVEVESPFYTNNLFVYAFSSTTGAATSFLDLGVYDDKYIRGINHKIFTNSTNTATSVYLLDWAAGEDFSLLRFQGAPWFSTTS
jgi:hypothetical protein